MARSPRDESLRALGYEVQRFNYRRVIDEPARVVRRLRARLVPPGGASR